VTLYLTANMLRERLRIAFVQLSVKCSSAFRGISAGTRWCMNRPTVVPCSTLGYQTTRRVTGMPNQVIRLRTLHPIFASVR
jgi:hypothetical protein